MRNIIRPSNLLLISGAMVLAGCNSPLDLDMRGALGGLDTASAARQATAERPRPDNRGVISYPSYQVAVARRGDTPASLAARVGTDAQALARHNGMKVTDLLREGEIVALPKRVAEPSPATGSVTTGPIQPPGVDITTLASGAIDKAGQQSVQTTALPAAQSAQEPKIARGIEPTKHKVQRGESAYTIARLYGVSVRSLAEWNGLGTDFAIREGQYLLIPVPEAGAEKAEAPTNTTEAPGVGSPAPVPPRPPLPPRPPSPPLPASPPSPPSAPGVAPLAP